MKDSPKWLVVAAIVLAFMTLGLGYWGFTEIHARATDSKTACTSEASQLANPQWLDLTNRTMQLFFANTDLGNYKNQKLPPTLIIATLTGYLTVLLLTIWAIGELLRQFTREGRLSGFPFLSIHPAAVVFNLPDTFRHLLTELAAKHQKNWLRCSTNPVVIVLPDIESPLAKACERAGLWVIEASSFDNDFLQRAGVARSKEIYIFGDQYTSNLDLALRCQKLFPNHEQTTNQETVNAYEIHVAVEDSDVLYALIPHTLGDPDSQATILPFSFAVIAARKALSNGRLATLPGGHETLPFIAQTNHVLMGSGRYVRAFFTEIIKSSVISLSERPTLHIISPEAQALEARLRAEITAWDLLHANIHFHPADANDPESFIASLQPVLAKVTDLSVPWNFYCLLAEDGNNFSLAARLAAELGAQSQPSSLKNVSRILFCCREADELSKQFKKFAEKCGLHMESLGSLTACSSLSTIRQEPSLLLAGFIHEGYAVVSKSKPELHDRPHALAAFQKLTLIKREQNFAQTDHIDIKLSLMGSFYDPMKAFWNRGGDKILLRKLSSDSEEPSVEVLMQMTKIEIDHAPLDHTSAIMIQVSEEVSLHMVSLDPDIPHGLEAEEPLVEVLAQMVRIEHLRWMQVMVLAGFCYNKTSNAILRHHDCLIPFSDPRFPKKTITFDIESLRILPFLKALQQPK